ncbi:shikimate dehydrogenase [Hansschlegelia plantiphila]|uniref:Shikimate dehydrogenase (NADP(+)) n=1 Tax=Hansschlegelia plantiphila TaxID=374655 RepID=A0A9W6J1S9_9HYPH|nr:shikimate dehydrogenase [Hansschlegelia plantiphila]GLK68782.1 shikimate dehydrogenase (NADP(+)) [Hansschlegelia plantiphila]
MSFPKACVMGWPVSQSRSPLIHGYWLKLHGVAGSYERAEVTAEDFPAFVRDLAGHGFVGGNVTVPHKEAAYAALEEADPSAAALGAANTLWLEDGRLKGANTDGFGFLANLDAAAPGWEGRRWLAVVLGAGGAARAVVHALRERGFSRVAVVNRTVSRALEVSRLAGSAGEAYGPDDLPELLAEAGLLVNATSLGMVGKDRLPIDLWTLPRSAVVTDLVYAPLETELLAAARARGNVAVDGLGMLLHQAVPGFERWFGVKPEVTEELRRLVAADIVGA